MGTIQPVPSTVRIFHRRAGHVHIFTSPELRGLHVGHSDLEQAFALIPEAVSGLVELETGIDAIYEPEAPFEEFRLKVSDDGELDLASPVLLMKVGAVPPSCFRYVAAWFHHWVLYDNGGKTREFNCYPDEIFRRASETWLWELRSSQKQMRFLEGSLRDSFHGNGWRTRLLYWRDPVWPGLCEGLDHACSRIEFGWCLDGCSIPSQSAFLQAQSPENWPFWRVEVSITHRTWSLSGAT